MTRSEDRAELVPGADHTECLEYVEEICFPSPSTNGNCINGYAHHTIPGEKSPLCFTSRGNGSPSAKKASVPQKVGDRPTGLPTRKGTAQLTFETPPLVGFPSERHEETD